MSEKYENCLVYFVILITVTKNVHNNFYYQMAKKDVNQIDFEQSLPSLNLKNSKRESARSL